MEYLNSSCIRAVEYNPSTGTLRIWFKKSGDPYTFGRVPVHIYHGLIQAESAGGFYATYIRGNYQI